MMSSDLKGLEGSEIVYASGHKGRWKVKLSILSYFIIQDSISQGRYLKGKQDWRKKGMYNIQSLNWKVFIGVFEQGIYISNKYDLPCNDSGVSPQVCLLPDSPPGHCHCGGTIWGLWTQSWAAPSCQPWDFVTGNCRLPVTQSGAFLGEEQCTQLPIVLQSSQYHHFHVQHYYLSAPDRQLK